MKRLLILLTILMLANSVAHSQNRDWSDIMSDPRNVWGEGWGTTVDEADKQALLSLASKISITVSGNFRQVEQQRVSSQSDEGSVELSSVQGFYSNVTLPNTHMVIVKKKKHLVHVGRWIRIDELEGIFDGRRNRALQYENDALTAENEGRIGDALRCHWWSHTLIKSLQNPDEVRDSQGHILKKFIIDEMNRLLDGLKVSCVERHGTSLKLQFRFLTSPDSDLDYKYENGRWVQGVPVTKLDFSYFDGRGWVYGSTVKDGETIVEMAKGALCEHLQLRIEYTYKDSARIDEDLYNMLTLRDSDRLSKSNILISVDAAD